MKRYSPLFIVMLLGCVPAPITLYVETDQRVLIAPPNYTPAQPVPTVPPAQCNAIRFKLPDLPTAPTLAPLASLDNEAVMKVLEVYMKEMILHERSIKETINASYIDYLDKLGVDP